MKNYLFTVIIIFGMVVPLWPITGLSIGAHAGIIQSYNYDLLNSKIAVMADDYGWDHSEANKQMSLIGAHANLGLLNIINVAGFVDYSWKKSELASDVDLKLSDVSFGLTGIKRFGVPFVDPYIGAGVAWHHFIYSLETSDMGIIIALPDNQTKVGYHIVAGVTGNFPIFPLAPYLEYRYNWINTEKNTTTYNTLSAGLSVKF